MNVCYGENRKNNLNNLVQLKYDGTFFVPENNNFTEIAILRSSRSQKFFKIGVLKNFTNFTGKHLCWNLFLIKLQAEAFNFIKNIFHHRCFPVNFGKLVRSHFL